jgi:hypothetical protein
MTGFQPQVLESVEMTQLPRASFSIGGNTMMVGERDFPLIKMFEPKCVISTLSMG